MLLLWRDEAIGMEACCRLRAAAAVWCAGSAIGCVVPVLGSCPAAAGGVLCIGLGEPGIELSSCSLQGCHVQLVVLAARLMPAVHVQVVGQDIKHDHHHLHDDR